MCDVDGTWGKNKSFNFITPVRTPLYVRSYIYRLTVNFVTGSIDPILASRGDEWKGISPLPTDYRRSGERGDLS